jgi:hypothetical protein
MGTINAFSELSAQNFHVINTANLVLLPKKDGADSITDFRPISLIHVAQRLSPKLWHVGSAPR